MSKSTKILFLLFLMMMTALLTVYITYAWFTLNKEERPIIINTGSLRATVGFYQGIDSDLDGTLDDNTYEEITEGGITFTHAIPGQIYTFKMMISNIGSVDGVLTLTVNDIVASNSAVLDGFEVTYIDPVTSQEETVVFNTMTDQDILLFTNYILPAYGGLITFDFTIQVTQNLSTAMVNESLYITNYHIHLIQVQE
ncbi:MAG: hypothetical protein PHP41_04810 [Bacilli bacterium]|jgi:hypothetical protein|nr:hypothetical protein [Bacilli bacterium]MDY0063697.1 hypothetical protein [Bacilli bacterium]